MKIAIVGTGAMGAVYAALLKKGGHEVWAIDSWAEHLDIIAGEGLGVSGASGTYVVDGIQVGSAPADAGPCDLWVVATKASDVDEVVRGIAPLLRPADVVMPFQNGLGSGERVARHIPESQIVIGIAEGFGSSIPEPGFVHHNGMRMAMWDDSVPDWSMKDPQKIADGVLAKVHDGSIIDLHDGLDGKPWVDRSVLVKALPLILDGLRARHLKPVRLDQLLGGPAYQSCAKFQN